MKKVLEFLNPDKVSMEIPPPGMGVSRYSSFRDRVRLYCFTAVVVIAVGIPFAFLVLLLEAK